MELLDVVDAYGNKIAVMDRDTVHEKNLLHYEVYCMIINDKKEVLLQKRSATKKLNPNIYAITAGHVDAGEDFETAIIREVKEELGLDIKKEELKKYTDNEVKIRERNSNISVYYYIKRNIKEDEFKIQEEELSEVKWFRIDDIIEMIKSGSPLIVWKEHWIPFFEIAKSL